MSTNQASIDVMKTSFIKAAIYYGIHEDEVRNEAWLIQNDFPEAKTNLDFLYKKIRNRLIQMNKSGGLSNRGGVSSMDSSERYLDHERFVGEDFELKMESSVSRSKDPLTILIEKEDAQAREKQIDALPSIDKERLKLLENCLHGKEFGLNVVVNLKKRQANETIRSWIEEDRSKRISQPDLFN